MLVKSGQLKAIPRHSCASWTWLVQQKFRVGGGALSPAVGPPWHPPHSDDTLDAVDTITAGVWTKPVQAGPVMGMSLVQCWFGWHLTHTLPSRCLPRYDTIDWLISIARMTSHKHRTLAFIPTAAAFLRQTEQAWPPTVCLLSYSRMLQFVSSPSPEHLRLVSIIVTP